MSTRLLALRPALVALVVLYVLIIVTLQLFWRTSTLNMWWIEVLNVFGLWLYLPLPLLLLLALLAQSRAAGLMLLVPLLLFGWEYAAMFVPGRTAGPGTPLRVMSWNVLYTNEDVAGIDALVRRHNPDIVALQEYSFTQALTLRVLLDARYPYRASAPGGPSGLGVWSRYPIQDWSNVRDRRAACACQRMRVVLPDQTIQLVNAHPKAPGMDYHEELGRWQLPIKVLSDFRTAHQHPVVDALLDIARTSAEPLLLVGDLNTNDRQPNYWRLRRYFDDAFQQSGLGFGLTWPSSGAKAGPFTIPPLVRIDYVLHTAGITAANAFTAASAGADHRAVIADLLVATVSPVSHHVAQPPAEQTSPELEGVTQ